MMGHRSLFRDGYGARCARGAPLVQAGACASGQRLQLAADLDARGNHGRLGVYRVVAKSTRPESRQSRREAEGPARLRAMIADAGTRPGATACCCCSGHRAACHRPIRLPSRGASVFYPDGAAVHRGRRPNVINSQLPHRRRGRSCPTHAAAAATGAITVPQALRPRAADKARGQGLFRLTTTRAAAAGDRVPAGPLRTRGLHRSSSCSKVSGPPRALPRGTGAPGARAPVRLSTDAKWRRRDGRHHRPEDAQLLGHVLPAYRHMEPFDLGLRAAAFRFNGTDPARVGSGHPSATQPARPRRWRARGAPAEAAVGQCAAGAVRSPLEPANPGAVGERPGSDCIIPGMMPARRSVAHRAISSPDGRRPNLLAESSTRPCQTGHGGEQGTASLR